MGSNENTPYSYKILWKRDFGGGAGNMGAAVDSNNNVVVCGINQDEDKGIVVKYDSEGNELWSDSDLPEVCNFGSAAESESKPIIPPLIKKIMAREYGYFFDVAVDSEDNIVVAGTFTQAGGTESVIYVKKYSPDGTTIWEKTYSPFQVNIASGIAVDPDGDIFVAGGGGSLTSLSFKGIVIKLSKSGGRMIWRAIRRRGMVALYTSVTADSNGDAIASGFSGYNNVNEMMATKFGGMRGWRRRELARQGNKAPTKITIDKEKNFVVAGKAGSEDMQYLLKFDRNFNIIWERERDEGFLYGAAVTEDGNIAVTGYKNGIDEYYAALFDKSTGEKVMDMMLGKRVSNLMDDYMRGIASVRNGNGMFITGARTVSRTMRVEITGTGPGTGGPTPPEQPSNPPSGPPPSPPPAPPHGGKESLLQKILRWIFGR